MAARTGRLHRDIQQSRPFRSLYQEAFLSVLKTADCFRRAVAGLLAPYGITPQQHNVLRILRGAEPDGLPTLAIAERLLEKTPGMTRLLDRLEAKRLIRRIRGGTDRRQVVCRVTAEGLRLLARTGDVITAPEQRLATVWKAAEAQALVGLLERAREAVPGERVPEEEPTQRSKR